MFDVIVIWFVVGVISIAINLRMEWALTRRIELMVRNPSNFPSFDRLFWRGK
jgi:hypothetical protein